MPDHGSRLLAPDVTVVTFYFDPACPWTWLTSRWLVEAAGNRSVPIEYSPFELSDGKPIDELPADRRATAAASRRFLRAVEVAHQKGDDALVGRWYTRYGNARWNEGAEPSAELVERTLRDAGGDSFTNALEDESLDVAVAESRAEAVRLAGDDAGSPVTLWQIGDVRRGFFGPVIAPKPSGADSDALWDVLTAATRSPQLFELKSRRTAKPHGALEQG